MWGVHHSVGVVGAGVVDVGVVCLDVDVAVAGVHAVAGVEHTLSMSTSRHDIAMADPAMSAVRLQVKEVEGRGVVQTPWYGKIGSAAVDVVGDQLEQAQVEALQRNKI